MHPQEDYAWFEVWADDTARPPYVLMLLGDADEKSLRVYDPRTNETIHRCESYQEAMFFLTEDEYTKVDGRVVE